MRLQSQISRDNMKADPDDGIRKTRHNSTLESLSGAANGKRNSVIE